MLIDANHTRFHRRQRDFGHTVGFDRVTASHDQPNQSGFDLVGFKEQDHSSVISPICFQTYIFTDGEDEELKKKIGKFYEGDFILRTEMHIVLLKKGPTLNL